jgi:DNA-binding ferritin-like protein
MFLKKALTIDDRELDRVAYRRAVTILRDQLVLTMDLAARVDGHLTRTNGNNPKIATLLNGLSDELQTSIAQIQRRIRLIARGTIVPQANGAARDSIWRSFDEDEKDLRSQMESLFCGYLLYAAATWEATRILERLTDKESVQLLNRLAAVAEKALWFIEAYLESIALHGDAAATCLPDWSRGSL